MKYRITRTSSRESVRPCDGALKENGYWVIEVKTLEQLNEIAETHGDIIVKPISDGIELEIYDDYRE